jgi:hypothetical protein
MGLVVWRCLAAATGLLGLVAAGLLWSPAALLGFPLVGGLVASVMIWCARESQDEAPGGGRSRLSRSVRDGYLLALALVAVGGLCSFLGSAGLLISIMVGLTSPPVVRRVAALLGRFGWRSSAVDRSPKDDVERIGQLTTSELCTAWITTGQHLRAASSPAALPLVRLRQLYLDELERRDPVGFNAWLSSSASAAGDPRRFLTP